MGYSFDWKITGHITSDETKLINQRIVITQEDLGLIDTKTIDEILSRYIASTTIEDELTV